MEPEIRYLRAADGAVIAYWTLGEGPPLVYLPSMPFTNIELEWRHPHFRSAYQSLARRRTLIRFDARGSGMSERKVEDYSLDARLLDLEAVVEHLDLDRFALAAIAGATPLAIAYAAGQPARVSDLILYGAYPSQSDYSAQPQVQALFTLMQTDWDMFRQALSHVIYGWSEAEGRAYADFLKGSVSQESSVRFFDSQGDVDLTPVLKRITARTLVLQRRDVPFPSTEISRGLAATIPNARLTVFDATVDEHIVLPRLIGAFLGDPVDAPGAFPERGVRARNLVTVLFTDIEGSTELTQRVGDEAAQRVLRVHNEVVRSALRDNGGGEIKHTGDGIMASFQSPSTAVDCAIQIQRAIAARDASTSQPLRVRIGINTGEPIEEEDDLFGTAVTTAARIMQQAQGGEILVSDVVRQLVAGKDFSFEDRGEAVLRGFDDPVRVYRVLF